MHLFMVPEKRRGLITAKINGVAGGNERCQQLKFSFFSLAELSPSGGRTVGVGTECSQKAEHRHSYQLLLQVCPVFSPPGSNRLLRL